jgi:hypothetical protein
MALEKTNLVFKNVFIFCFSVTDAMCAQGKSVPDVLSGGTCSDAYSRILKYKFEATVGTPAWADLSHRNTMKSSSSEDDDDDDDNDLDNELLRVRKASLLSVTYMIVFQGNQL